MWHRSIGSITDSRFWLSIQRRPFNIRRWFIGFGKTYVGTTHGICIIVPGFSILGHIRDTNLKHEEKTWLITTPEPVETRRMIYRVKFNGRKVGAIGIVYDIVSYCYGDNEDEARIELSDRYDHVMFPKFEETPIVKTGETKAGDQIYMIENGRLIGHIKPRESAYTIVEVPTVGNIKVRGCDWVVIEMDRNLDCIVHGHNS